MSESVSAGDTQEAGKTRRGFLSFLGGAAAGAAGIKAFENRRAIRKFAEDIYLDYARDVDHVNDRTVQEAQAHLEREYGIRVSFAGYLRWPDHRIDPLTAVEAQNALATLIVALAKYPAGFFRRNPLPTIEIGKNFRIPRGDVPYVPWSDDLEYAGGTADAPTDYVTLSFQRDPGSFETTIHHELYHILDLRNPRPEEHAQWLDIMNDCDCSPYVGGDPLQIPILEGNRFDAYAEPEGIANPNEDRATVANALMMPVTHARLMTRLKDAEVNDVQVANALKRKIEMIKADYLAWSGGAMDERYWARIRAAGEAYLVAHHVNDPSYSDYDYEGEVVVYGSYYEYVPEDSREPVIVVTNPRIRTSANSTLDDTR